MTDFASIKLLYNRYSALCDEIKSLIDYEDYESVYEVIFEKDKLIKQIAAAKRTVVYKEGEEAEHALIENEVKNKDAGNIEHLKNLYNQIGSELKKTQKTVKVNNAYAKSQENKSGVFVDIEE